MTLIELLVATSIMSLIILAAFKILMEGSQYLRINQMALDAQRNGLALLSQIGSGLQSTRKDLIKSDADGVVFASPVTPSGTVDFDPINGELKWQKWVCFYYDSQKVTRRERALSLPTTDPGPPPAPSSFNSVQILKVLGKEISTFNVSQVSANPAVWAINLTSGSMTDNSRYGLELYSQVGPKN